MQDALIPVTTPPKTSPAVAVAESIARWKESGALRESDSLALWMIDNLATTMDRAAPYAKANIAKTLADMVSQVDERMPKISTEFPISVLAAMSDGESLLPGTMAVAAMLGVELMPWQISAAREITRIDKDGDVRPRFVISVPRQCGKTTLVGIIAIQRMLASDGFQSVYTAQTGKDAGSRWADIVAEVLDSSISRGFSVRRSLGTESLKYGRSSLSPFPPKIDAIHGDTINQAILDESFSLDRAQGDGILGAVGPAMVTQQGSQVIILSTVPEPGEGDWFMDELERANNNGYSFTIHYPTDGDPYDIDAVYSWHPAAGITVTRKSLAELANSLPEIEWRRAVLNQRPRDDNRVYELFDPALWESCPTIDSLKRTSVMAVDASSDLTSFYIAAAEKTQSGIDCGLIGTYANIGDVVDTIREAQAIMLDDTPQNRIVVGRLEQAGLSPCLVTFKDAAQAVSRFVEATKLRQIRHPLDGLGDIISTVHVKPAYGGFAIKRDTEKSGALISLTLAAFRVDDQAPIKPSIYFIPYGEEQDR